ncbi:MAG: RtcB family protein [Nanoarchaeota archaeon]|nr:RtcB family protein [Nanoarchaeota archaeon]
MMKYINTERVIVKSWCNNPDEGAIDQAVDLAELPFVFKQVCLMPDTHRGYGMPIGGVIATHNVIIPNAVGVDIGCGICAVKTNIKASDLTQDKIKEVFGGSAEYHGGIRSRIPVGFHKHKKAQEWDGFDIIPYYEPIVNNLENITKQLGTLGGGNHFIEIQKDEKDFVWVMIHSGSRNLGYQIAKFYNKIAQTLCEQWCSNIPTVKGDDGLAFFPHSSHYYEEYSSAMNFALEYALENRKRMMSVCEEELARVMPGAEFEPIINIHHNYAAMENHFGKNVMVHRKGATRARKDEIGIIAGSQGTSSYIVKGKGNPDSFMSCSHGAGRKMSRNKAIKNLNLDTEVAALDKKGILHTLRNKKALDEAPSAYKDIDVVMSEQTDLVDILHKLTPLAVIKG